MPAQVCVWLCSPCTLEGKPGGGASGGVCIQLAGCAAAALGELTTRLLAFPTTWVEELLSTLALTLVRRHAQSAALRGATARHANLLGRSCASGLARSPHSVEASEPLSSLAEASMPPPRPPPGR